MASVRFWNLSLSRRQVYFAWDRFQDERLIDAGIERVLAAGIKAWQMAFFVLIGYDTDARAGLLPRYETSQTRGRSVRNAVQEKRSIPKSIRTVGQPSRNLQQRSVGGLQKRSLTPMLHSHTFDHHFWR